MYPNNIMSRDLLRYTYLYNYIENILVSFLIFAFLQYSFIWIKNQTEQHILMMIDGVCHSYELLSMDIRAILFMPNYIFLFI